MSTQGLKTHTTENEEYAIFDHVPCLILHRRPVSEAMIVADPPQQHLTSTLSFFLWQAAAAPLTVFIKWCRELARSCLLYYSSDIYHLRSSVLCFGWGGNCWPTQQFIHAILCPSRWGAVVGLPASNSTAAPQLTPALCGSPWLAWDTLAIISHLPVENTRWVQLRSSALSCAVGELDSSQCPISSPSYVQFLPFSPF